MKKIRPQSEHYWEELDDNERIVALYRGFNDLIDFQHKMVDYICTVDILIDGHLQRIVELEAKVVELEKDAFDRQDKETYSPARDEPLPRPDQEDHKCPCHIFAIGCCEMCDPYRLLHQWCKDHGCYKSTCINGHASKPKWLPAYDDEYWSLEADGKINQSTWFNDKIDNGYRDWLGVYKTKEEAEAVRDRIKKLLKEEE